MNDIIDNLTTTEVPRVQSAEKRFRHRQSSRLTNVQLRLKNTTGQSRDMHREGGRGTYKREVRKSLIREATNDIFQSLSQQGLDIEERDLKGKLQDIPEKPDFPHFMFLVAFAKDIIDVPANLLVVGVVVSFALSLVFSLLLFFWFLGKLNGSWWKRALIKKLILRFVLCATIEMLPFGSIVPASTILVLMTYYREKKVVILLNAALEKMRGKKIPGM